MGWPSFMYRFIILTLLLCAFLAEGADITASGVRWQGVEANIKRTAQGYSLRSPYASVNIDTPESAIGASPLLTFLYAMTQQEIQASSVSQISDYSFNHFKPIPCDCFETGEKWRYVWTRDVSYAIDLALGTITPQRSLNSLLFKQSVVEPGLTNEDAILVAQDTGSGGSWPISSDRVVWFLAMANLYPNLDTQTQTAVMPRIQALLWHTLNQDRQYVFNAELGLYKGETSYLDWREQTYPYWTREDTRFVGESFALSTNVLHYIGLNFAANIFEDDAKAATFRQRAERLKASINRHFWNPESGMYVSYLGTSKNPIPSHTYDLLGLSLAIVHNIANEQRARQIMANYPVAPSGPPVIWPQQRDVPIYHNQAIWPFVTAYGLKAARKTGHAKAISAYARSLIRGAALYGSNMENFEWLTQEEHHQQGDLSGPVINSRRQLWSVAAMANLIHEGIFGLQIQGERLIVSPQVPASDWHWIAGDKQALKLKGFGVHKLNVTLYSPKNTTHNSPGALWRAGKITLNGAALEGDYLSLAKASGELEIWLEETLDTQPLNQIQATRASELSEVQKRTLFAPTPPELRQVIGESQGIRLNWKPNRESNTKSNIYRNGHLIASGVSGNSWLDTPDTKGRACYAITQYYSDTRLSSQPSQTLCLSKHAWRVFEHTDVTQYQSGKAFLPAWGKPLDTLDLSFIAERDGSYAISFDYANGMGPINTGITAGVKWLKAQCGAQRSQGAIVMPHRESWQLWGQSSELVFYASSGDTCQFRLSDGFNMSYLKHFRWFTNGEGGKPINQVNLGPAHIRWLGNNKNNKG